MPLATEHDMGFDGSVEIPLDDGCGRRRDMPAKGIPDIDLLTRDQNLHRRYRVGTARIRLMDSTGNLPPSRVPYEPRGPRKSRGHPGRCALVTTAGRGRAGAPPKRECPGPHGICPPSRPRSLSPRP